LTHWWNVIALAAMRTKIFLTVAGAAVVVALAGCIDTVGGGKTPGMPFIRDSMAGRYERPLEQAYQAAKDVIEFNGKLVSETTLHGQTNLVKTVEGKVNQRSIWVRVEGVAPNVTQVTVQARTPGGGSDIDLVHEIEKQIALKLVVAR
jgi:hypothetical protein